MLLNKGTGSQKRLRWRGVAGLLLTLVLVGIALGQYGGVSGLFRSLSCMFTRQWGQSPRYKFDGFFTTSTVKQSINTSESENCVIRRDEEGLSFITLIDPKKIGIIRVNITKEFDDYIFYPRVSQGSEVLVCESSPENVLLRLASQDGWTPLGRRYVLNLSCCEHGAVQQQIQVSLLIILRGEWAQLWIPAGMVFFR